MLVTFNSTVSSDAVSGANSLSFYSSADKRELVKLFSGDTGRLEAFVVPGNSVHYVADIKSRCGPVAFTVVPLRGYWTQVRACCQHHCKASDCVPLRGPPCVLHSMTYAMLCCAVLRWGCCCRASLQERSLAREPSLPWALWVLNFLLSMEQVLFPLSPRSCRLCWLPPRCCECFVRASVDVGGCRAAPHCRRRCGRTACCSCCTATTALRRHPARTALCR